MNDIEHDAGPQPYSTERRISHAAAALAAHRKSAGVDDTDGEPNTNDLVTDLTDLLADLQHWAARHGIVFEVALGHANEHYEEERLDDYQ